MTPARGLDLKRWVQNWRNAGVMLEQLRRDDLLKLDTVAAVSALSDAFDLAVASAAPRLGSGLVEQQRLFAILRRRLEQGSAR